MLLFGDLLLSLAISLRSIFSFCYTHFIFHTILSSKQEWVIHSTIRVFCYRLVLTRLHLWITSEASCRERVNFSSLTGFLSAFCQTGFSDSYVVTACILIYDKGDLMSHEKVVHITGSSYCLTQVSTIPIVFYGDIPLLMWLIVP